MEASCSDEQEGDVVKRKGLIICRCPGIFAGAETTEEGDTHHIGYCFVFQRWIGSVCKKKSVYDQCDGNGLDTDRHRVVLIKRLQL